MDKLLKIDREVEVESLPISRASVDPPTWTTQVSVPGNNAFRESADQRVAAAIAAGGRVVDQGHTPAFVVLADQSGNKACICTELGRG